MERNDADTLDPHYQRVGVRALLLGLGMLLLGTGLAAWGSYLLHQGIGASYGLPPDNRLPAMMVIVGAIVSVLGLVVSLGWYSGKRIGIQGVPRHRTAVWVGAGWGVLAAAITAVLEVWSQDLPGAWGAGALNSVLSGPIEEGLKLLVPVGLLIFSTAWRNPKLGFWLSFSAAAGFAVLEGVAYVLSEVILIITAAAGDNPGSHALQVGLSTFDLGLAELAHPIYTASAAAVIWIAAWTLPKFRAVGVGIVAFLIAAALHSFSDTVLGIYIARINPWLSAGITFVFVVVIFFIWFRPELSHLNQVFGGNEREVEAEDRD